MVRYLKSLEPRRGCGYRHVGKLYVIGTGLARECHRLPLPLTFCPVCGSGFKHTRGWVKLNPAKIFGKCPSEYLEICPFCGEPLERVDNIWVKCLGCEAKIEFPKFERCECIKGCYVCNPPEKAFLLWVGEKYYPTPEHFINEAIKLGVSKAVPSIPKDFELGVSKVYLAHLKAVRAEVKDEQTLTGYKPIKIAGIFYAFIPQRFELLVKESDFKAEEEKYLKMEEQGIEIIVVPDNYEEMVKKAEEEYKAKKSKKYKKKNKSTSNNKTLAELIAKTVEKVEAKGESWND